MSNLPLVDIKYFLEDVALASKGESVYDVIPDVDPTDINTWRNYISEKGLYYRLEFFKDITNIYYATEDYINTEYSTGGWTR